MEKNIKEIVDLICIEGDLSPSQYPVSNRVTNVNSEYAKLIEEAVQIGSDEPIANAEARSETFTTVNPMELNTFTRTIKNVPVFRVDFQYPGGTRWEPMEQDALRPNNEFCFLDMKFYSDEKQFYVENARPGTFRVTYARGAVTFFTTADYSLPSPPKPDWLPPVFHDLLWLIPAYDKAQDYKPERAASLKNKIDQLKIMFRNHYIRKANSHAKVRATTNGHVRTNYR